MWGQLLGWVSVLTVLRSDGTGRQGKNLRCGLQPVLARSITLKCISFAATCQDCRRVSIILGRMIMVYGNCARAIFARCLSRPQGLSAPLHPHRLGLSVPL